MAKYAEVEKIRKAYRMSIEGLCEILCIKTRTYYEWGINDIPEGSKCHPFLDQLVKNHADIIKNHTSKYLKT